MKKATLLAAILLCLTTISYAQKFSWGLKAGLNASGISNFEKVMSSAVAISGVSSGTSLQSKLYFNVSGGAFARLQLSEQFSLQPEVSYSVQGYGSQTHYGYNGDTGTMRLNMRLSYINVPVMLQYHPASRFYVEAGPQLGILTSAKVIAKIGGNSSTENAKEIFNTADVAAAFGAGYELGSFPLGFYARFLLGFTDVAKNNATGMTFKNRTGQIGVFYRFHQ